MGIPTPTIITSNWIKLHCNALDNDSVTFSKVLRFGNCRIHNGKLFRKAKLRVLDTLWRCHFQYIDLGESTNTFELRKWLDDRASHLYCWSLADQQDNNFQISGLRDSPRSARITNTLHWILNHQIISGIKYIVVVVPNRPSLPTLQSRQVWHRWKMVVCTSGVCRSIAVPINATFIRNDCWVCSSQDSWAARQSWLLYETGFPVLQC